MPEQWQVKDALRHLSLVRYLLSRADSKNLTHGEKHHLHEVAGMELLEAMHILGDDRAPMARNIETDITDATSDIPF